jgi:hypothetical protein
MRTSIDTKRERCERANELLRVIASCGRRFFSQDEDRLQRMENPQISRLEVDDRGRVWFTDKYTQKRIYLHYEYWKRGFSDGGTLRSLVCSLRDYIMTGKRLHAWHFGPWPAEYCRGDLWGYGEDMQQVRDAALRLVTVDTNAGTR